MFTTSLTSNCGMIGYFLISILELAILSFDLCTLERRLKLFDHLPVTGERHYRFFFFEK